MVIREIHGKRGTKLIIDGRLADGTRVREKVAAYDPKDPEGKRVAWAKARALKRDWEQEIAAGIFSPPSASRKAEPAAVPVEAVTFGAYAARFLASSRATQEHRNRLPQFVARWADRPLRSIARADVKAWIDERMAEVSASTLRKDASVLSVLFKDAIDAEVVEINPVSAVRLPKNDSEPGGAYEPAEVAAILAAVPADCRRALEALALTGARAKEIRGLTWADYREGKGTVLLRRFKTRTVTEFPVSDELAAVIEECRKAPVVNREYVFADDAGTAWASEGRRRRLTRAVEGARKRLGIHAPTVDALHGFRHYFATQAVRRGVPIERLSYLLGHTNISMTARYFKVTAEDCREAVRGHGLGTGVSREKQSR